MDEKPKMVPFGDITIVTGQYEKDGQTRNRYKNIGTLFVSENSKKALTGHRVSIKLDALPNGGSGWLSVFEKKPTNKDVFDNLPTTDIEQEPINLNDIPF